MKTDPAPLVVGLDGSELSAAALDWAAAEAARRGARVVAVTVHSGSADLDTATEHVRRAARGHPGVTITHERRTGLIADTLLSAADGAAMLVIGSHGANGVLSALLGSVAAYCVRHARGPVVLIPPALAAPIGAPRPDSALTPGPLL